MKMDIIYKAVSEEAHKKLIKAIDGYKKLGINITPVKSDDSSLIVQVEQKKILNEKILNSVELKERAALAFKSRLDPSVKLIIIPVNTNIDELRTVNAQYIVKKMGELNLRPIHIAAALDVDLTSIEQMLNGSKNINKAYRAALYYYLKNMDIRRML